MLKSACVIASLERLGRHPRFIRLIETTCVLHLGLKRGLMLLWTRLRMASVGQISFPGGRGAADASNARVDYVVSYEHHMWKALWPPRSAAAGGATCSWSPHEEATVLNQRRVSR